MSVIIDEITGLEKACVRTAEGTTAAIYLHGAHVVSFIPTGCEDVLFVSKQAVFKPTKAIRGGTPVCWPQFNDMGPLTSHGFARNSKFSVKEIIADKVVLQLTSADVSAEAFPSGWTLLVTVAVSDDNGGTLRQTVTCMNEGPDDLSTTNALHTYYRVSNIDKISVRGLEGTPYHDNLDGRMLKPASSVPVVIAQEVDRIYTGAGREIYLLDGGAGQEVVVEKEGFDDVVLWNPWVDKAISLGDFADEEYQKMVCIEPANAAKYLGGESAVIKSGQTWDASQTIHVRRI